MKKFWLVSIRFYQKYLSPDKGLVSRLGLGPVCRFTPTCSEYTYQAIAKYGVVAGWKLGLKRIFHCHPFTQGGFDPLT
jgi:putative membrane protein insertion efficiency factor